MTDPIADMITRIRNAYMAKKSNVRIPHSILKEKVARKLDELGYIQTVELVQEDARTYITVNLVYQNKLPSVTSIKRVSTPGRRIYVNKTHIPTVLSGYGTSILSTSKGIMTDKEAKQAGVGGEIILQVW